MCASVRLDRAQANLRPQPSPLSLFHLSLLTTFAPVASPSRASNHHSPSTPPTLVRSRQDVTSPPRPRPFLVASMKSFTSFTLHLATLAALANAQGGVVENAAVASAITVRLENKGSWIPH